MQGIVIAVLIKSFQVCSNICMKTNELIIGFLARSVELLVKKRGLKKNLYVKNVYICALELGNLKVTFP